MRTRHIHTPCIWLAASLTLPLFACSPRGNGSQDAHRTDSWATPGDSAVLTPEAGPGVEATVSDAPLGHPDASITGHVDALVRVDSHVAPDVAISPPGCGTCPSGFTCASSGVCKSASGVPHFSHVFVLYMENFSYDSIIGSTAAPYVNGLAAKYGLATNYWDVHHPSLPNYLALSAGDYFGVGSDCLPADCPQGATNVADQLEGAGLTWHAYNQSMGSACNLSNAYPYAPKHNPLVYFTDIQGTSRCTNNDVDLGQLGSDLASGGSTFMTITPDLCHDMHDDCGGGAIQSGDSWLAANVPAILSSKEWSDNGVLFLVWDEGDSGGDQVVMLVISPLGKPSYQASTKYSHYSLVATLEDAYGLPRLAHAATATPMAEFFR